MPLSPLESSNKMPFFSNFCPHSLPIPSNVHTLRPGSRSARRPGDGIDTHIIYIFVASSYLPVFLPVLNLCHTSTQLHPKEKGTQHGANKCVFWAVFRTPEYLRPSSSSSQLFARLKYLHVVLSPSSSSSQLLPVLIIVPTSTGSRAKLPTFCPSSW